MDRKTGTFLLVATLAALLLTGCGVVELSEKEEDLIATYSAGVLLNDCTRYKDRLIIHPEEPLASKEPVQGGQAETPVPEETVAPVSEPQPEVEKDSGEESEPEETKVPLIPLNDLYKLKGVSITYTGYEFCKEYPKKSDSFQVSASEDEILLVVKFKVKNQSNAMKKIDLINRTISYELSADDSKYNPTISVLENGGLNFLSTSIKAGKEEEAVIIYAVPKKVRDAGHLSILIKEKNKQSGVTMK